MSTLWKDHPEAISNTQKIADSCDLKLDFNITRIPHFETPNSKTAEEYLTEIYSQNTNIKKYVATSKAKSFIILEKEKLQ